jgi:hypothetical protein
VQYLTTQFLAGIAFYMGESRIWRNEDWKEAAIIYSAFLAKPGANKTCSLNVISDAAIQTNIGLKKKSETIASGMLANILFLQK